ADISFSYTQQTTSIRISAKIMSRISIKTLLFLAIIATFQTSLWAQWPMYPTRGVPKTADGKPDLNAPAPRTADGKPDFPGLGEAGRGGAGGGQRGQGAGGQRGQGPGGQRGAAAGTVTAPPPPNAPPNAQPEVVATANSGPPLATFFNV